MPGSRLVEEVERILVDGLASQDTFARFPKSSSNELPSEPDSLEITWAVLEKVADIMEHEMITGVPNSLRDWPSWIRKQVNK